MDAQPKPHRAKKEVKKHSGSNPRAFTFNRPGRLQIQAARSSDLKEKRLHVPLVDRITEEPPPRLVAIVGPPGVGKTTLLKSLIRRYAKETITDPQGPITVVTGKKQRLTFLECPNELEAMVDVAKIADIVLLLIDGNYGFEMETMEFLNVLGATGMPGNVFGILTHLDLFKKPQTLRDAKKRLKHRLWAELYQGAHLFFLSGVINGRYPDREVHNISRFLSVMKNPRPLIWRNSHPYAIADSWRDVTHPTKIEENEKCDRTIVLSGYLRGTNFSSQGQRVHIPGLGDYTIASMDALPDPCPTPAMEKAIQQATGKIGRKRLDDKDKKVHAPMSDRSGLKVDGDAVYIYRDKGFNFDKDAEGERGAGEELIIGLQSGRRLLGQTEEGVQLFSGGEQVREAHVNGYSYGDSGRKTPRMVKIIERTDSDDDGGAALDNDEDEGFFEDEASEAEEGVFEEAKLGKVFQDHDNVKNGGDMAFADSDSEFGSMSGDEVPDFGDGDEGAALRWKENLAERAQQRHGRSRAYDPAYLARLLYDESVPLDQVISKWKGEDDSVGGDEEDIEANSDDEDEFMREVKGPAEDAIPEERSVQRFDYEELRSCWEDEEHIADLRQQRFATGNRREGGDDDDEGSNVEGNDGDDDLFDDEDEGDGAFEDLETGEKHGLVAEEEPAATLEEERERNARRKEELKLRFEDEDREGFTNDKAMARREGGQQKEFGEDDWYDAQKAQIQKQLDINKSEYDHLDDRQRVAVEGYRAGQYGKIVLEGVPAEFVENFSAKVPLVVGGLSATEDRFGYMQMRLKKHRWHKKILKTGDPLIFSLGWRRFQTMPIYSTTDSRTRNRMLKYTPEHMHCFGTFYGPLVPPNTGFTAFQSFSTSNPGFRMAATGTIMSVDESTEIVKKLKLTGTPVKIFKNTAFIQGMFNSSLEVAKFEGVAIRTVSGVRGQVKRALAKPEGQFRATFEDKVLASDIVFLRAWYPIKPHRFYNPVTNLLGNWQRMRLTGEVRRDEGLPTPQNKDSQYKPIVRETRRFNPLHVPRNLAADLPFKSQIVQAKPQRKQTYMAKRAVVLGGEEKRARDLMIKLATIRKDVAAKRAVKKEENREKYRKKIAEGEAKKLAREKRESKEFWSKEGRKRARDEDGGGGKRRKRP